MDTVEHTWAGAKVAASSSREVDRSHQRTLPDDIIFLADLDSGLAVIEEGGENLNAEAALLLLKGQLETIETDIYLQAGLGIEAARLVEVSEAVFGIEMSIGEKIYASTKLDGLVNDTVRFRLTFAIDNTDLNRQIAFNTEMKRVEVGDSILGIDENTTTPSPGITVPTTPFEVFEHNSVSTGVVDNFTLFGITRIDVSVLGGVNPTNNPILLRITKRYRKRLD